MSPALSIPQEPPARHFSPARPKVLHALIVLGAASPAIGFLLYLLIIVPKFKQIFAEFGVALPWVSAAMVDTSAWLTGQRPGGNIPGLFLVVPLALAALVGLAFLLAGRSSRIAAIILLSLLFLSAAAAFVAGITAMNTPLVTIIENLQQAGP